jgi:hypothetical protein
MSVHQLLMCSSAIRLLMSMRRIAVVDFLASNGLVCWIGPRDVRAIESYVTQIQTALDESTAMILLLSESAARSPYVQREVRHFPRLINPLIVLQLDSCHPARLLKPSEKCFV